MTRPAVAGGPSRPGASARSRRGALPPAMTRSPPRRPSSRTRRSTPRTPPRRPLCRAQVVEEADHPPISSRSLLEGRACDAASGRSRAVVDDDCEERVPASPSAPLTRSAKAPRTAAEGVRGGAPASSDRRRRGRRPRRRAWRVAARAGRGHAPERAQPGPARSRAPVAHPDDAQSTARPGRSGDEPPADRLDPGPLGSLEGVEENDHPRPLGAGRRPEHRARRLRLRARSVNLPCYLRATARIL